MMKPIGAACEEKRKNRTVSTFLKKTYELLNVRFSLLRTASTRTRSGGLPRGSALLSQMRRYSPRWSSPSTSSTPTTPPSLDRYPPSHSAQHVQLPQNTRKQPGKLLPPRVLYGQRPRRPRRNQAQTLEEEKEGQLIGGGTVRLRS